MALCHEGRTTFWGNWGIDFFEIQPDPQKNYGIPVGFLQFPIGTRGPIDSNKTYYRHLISEWIHEGVLPPGIVKEK